MPAISDFRKSFVLFASALALSGLFTPSVHAIDAVNVNDGGTIFQATGNSWAHFPNVIGYDANIVGGTSIKRLIALWGDGADVVGSPGAYHAKHSTDGGKTWGTVYNSVYTQQHLAGYERSDGTYFAAQFEPYGILPGSGDHQIQFNYFTSSDQGVTWQSFSDGIYHLGTHTGTGIRPGCDIRDPDGSGKLYRGIYGSFDGAAEMSPYLFTSTNGGVTWNYLSRIANGANYTGDETGETGLEFCSDGSWVAVFRTKSNQPMYQARSTDQGVTWSTPIVVPGLSAGAQQQSVLPRMLMLPNGVLVLSYGRLGCKLAFSEAGTGATWTNYTLTRADTNSGVLGTETTANQGVDTISSNRFIQIGDTGANWSYSTQHPSPNPFSIWTKFIDVVRTGQSHRIDLKTKYRLGIVSVSGDLTYSNANKPQARPTGAFDGSNNYWASAFKTGASGTMTIDLGQAYAISTMGIMLHYGNPESASIYFSTDGSTWGTAVKTYSSAKHYACNYTTFGSPITARYVKVDVSGAGVGGRVALNEIELYTSSMDTFESSGIEPDAFPHGVVPAGYLWNGTSSTQYGFAVREAPTKAGFESERSLEMWDSSSTWFAGIRKAVSQSLTKSWQFRYKPVAFESGGVGGHTFQIFGNVTGVGALTQTYYFAVLPNGSVQYYNGSAWVNVAGAPAGTFTLNAWHHVRVDVTAPNAAALFVNGVAKGTIPTYRTPANIVGLNGFAFGSSGTASSGDRALYDDISMN